MTGRQVLEDLHAGLAQSGQANKGRPWVDVEDLVARERYGVGRRELLAELRVEAFTRRTPRRSVQGWVEATWGRR